MFSKPTTTHRVRVYGSLPLKKRKFQPFKHVSLDSSLGAAISPLPSAAPVPIMSPPSTTLLPLLDHPFGVPAGFSDDKIAALALVAAASSQLSPSSFSSPIPESIAHSTEATEMSSTTSSEEQEEGEEEDLSSREPLPGGCHGRSSRHNCFCRRQPCYNGSNYCKLHYRQYVVRAEDAGCPPPESRSGGHKVHPQHHQDRRFMGNPGEIRCLATTTRGRACAYIAVHDTKYCYLHADYDTNPPPRRGGCGTLSSSLKAEENVTTTSTRLAEKRGLKKRLRSSEAIEELPRPASESLSVSAIPSVSTEDSKALRKKTPPRRTSAKLKEKHADSPFPLLSMIATDQWGQKKVRVATGPFKGRTGEVKKWGNGWVTIRIPGVGMHNRRSFELYLIEAESAAETTSTEAGSLFRCVSHDAGSPMPAAMVTPRPIKSTMDSAGDAPKMSVAFTPPTNQSMANRVTPSVLQKPRVETSVPLVDSLLLAASDGTNKKFDMLFGTAAPERSRRSIHKPTRYEDDAMLKKKRSHGTEDEESCTKRLHAHASK